MSRLEELIQELCPDGVEYKKLKEVCRFQNGFSFKSAKFTNEGKPILRITNIQDNSISGEFVCFSKDDYKENLESYLVSPGDTVVAMSGATTGKIGYNYSDKCYYLNQRVGLFVPNESWLMKRYLFHWLSSQTQNIYNVSSGSGAQPNLSSVKMMEFVIPLPPIPVQEEIVRVLDSFTELTAELTTELTARKKQFEYYRDELLKPKTNIPMVRLKEIATSIYRGAGIKRDQVTEVGIPCVRYGEIYTTYNTWFDVCVSHTKEEYVASPKYFENGDILFAITGESVEDIAKSIAYVGHDKCLAGGDIVVMKHEQNPRYLAHVLNTSMVREQKSKGKVKSKVVHSNVPSIEQIEIPLPPLNVQNRYAEVLDNFEKICNDLNIGLPAEIDARQKQYEFYRNLLLTFAETGNTIAQTDRQNIIRLIQYVFGYAPVKLGEIATIVRGGNFQKKDFVENGRPCIHYGQMYTHFGIAADKTLTFVNEEVFSKSKTAKTGDIVMAVTSENVEDVCSCTAWLGNEDIAISGHTAIVSHNQNPKFLSYYFHSAMFFDQKKKLAHGTKVIEVTPSKLSDIVIMLPTIEEQNRIVSILDRFDALCNSISEGLPAEIDARIKQYEFYRDKLLTFKKGR